MIAIAVQRGLLIYVYDAKGALLATLPAGSGPHDGLVGYSGESLSVRRGRLIYVYDHGGRLTSHISIS